MRRKLLVGLIVVASLAVLAPSLPPGGTFFDDDASIHEGNIEAIAAAGITKGCNPPHNNRYCPTDFVTREQMASFITRAEGLTDSGTGDYFIDDDTSIHQTDIDRIATAEITKGCNPPDNDEYCPRDYVTREQMASFMARAYGLTPMTPPDRPDLALETIIDTGLVTPTLVTAPAGDDRLFILEKPGRVRIYDEGALVATPFLDISSSVFDSHERGLLGLVFHPDYATNGRFFVYYSRVDVSCGNHRSILAEYGVSEGDPDIADPTETVILSFCQPTGVHNGGMLAFGPDGNLFIGSGDGGGGNDANDNAQNKDTLLGAMLRINVDGAPPYTVPADNPYVGTDGADEIYAIGLRNPWRYSIDGDDIYLGDVGQNTREEIDVFSATDPGLNFGWPRYEGNLCVKFAGETTCDTAGMTFPVLEHAAPSSDSITGGYVYRGSSLGWVGHYFYGDFSDGYVKSAVIIDGVAHNETDWTSTFGAQTNLASFGVDGYGELYLVLITGVIKKFVVDI